MLTYPIIHFDPELIRPHFLSMISLPPIRDFIAMLLYWWLLDAMI
jgi:hypothetical protein